MEAIAKHDFNATADDELSFRKNQILKVKFSIMLRISYLISGNMLGVFFDAVYNVCHQQKIKLKIKI